MKYMQKALSVLSLLAVVAGFTACSEDEALTEKLNSEQVYFPNTMSTTVEITADASSVEVPVMRMGNDAVSIPLTVEADEENILELEVPSTVNFEAGKNESTITIKYNPEKVEPGKYDSVKLSFGSDYNTPYGNSSANLKIGQAEPWISLGKGTFTDNWVFGGESPVEIQQNQLYPNRFRVIDPFKEIALSNDSEPVDPFSEYMEITILKKGDVYKGVTITQDDIIVFNEVNTGYAYDDSHDIWMGHPSEFKSMLTDDSKWGNCRVVDYQENGLPTQFAFGPMFYVQNLAGDYLGGWNRTGETADVVITFPGVVIADYSAEVSYSGKFEDAEGTIFAVADVALGEDVASAKATVVAGRNNAEEAVNGIIEGTLENIVDVTASGEVRIPMPADAASGPYTIGVVTYDAAGEAQDYSVTTFNYSASGEVAETWTPAYIGNYTYKFVFCNNDGTPYVDEGLTLYQSDSNENRYKIEHCFNDVDFVFEFNEDGTLSFEDQYTGYTDSSAGDLMFCDMNALYPDYFPTKSYYNNGTFYFNIGFYANDGWWGYDQSDDNSNLETFTLTAEAGAKGANKAPAKGKKNVKRPVHAKKNVLGRPVKIEKI